MRCQILTEMWFNCATAIRYLEDVAYLCAKQPAGASQYM